MASLVADTEKEENIDKAVELVSNMNLPVPELGFVDWDLAEDVREIHEKHIALPSNMRRIARDLRGRYPGVFSERGRTYKSSCRSAEG